VRYVVVHDDVYRAQGEEPPALGPGVRLLRTFGPVRVFQLTAKPIDLTRHLQEHAGEIADQFGLARPEVSSGGGFYPSETYPGFQDRFRWMGKSGSIEIANGESSPVRIWLEGFGFSNGVVRRLALVDPAGNEIASEAVPTNMGPIKIGPFDAPPGTSRWTLEASPGPTPLGASDPRSASVYLSDLKAARDLDLTRTLRKTG
jgi:hypothetical protein